MAGLALAGLGMAPGSGSAQTINYLYPPRFDINHAVVNRVPSEPGDDEAREKLFTLFNLPRELVIGSASAFQYRRPINARTLTLVGPVVIQTPEDDGGHVRAPDVEINAFEIRFVGSEASLTIQNNGRSFVVPRGKDLSIVSADKSKQPTRGGRITIRAGKITFEEPAILGMVNRWRQSAPRRWTDNSPAVLKGRLDEIEGKIRSAPKMAFLEYFLTANNWNGGVNMEADPQFVTGGGFDRTVVRDISDYFTPERDTDYIDRLKALITGIRDGFPEAERTHDYSALYRDLIIYNALPRFSPVLKDAAYRAAMGEVNAARNRLPPLNWQQFSYRGPSGAEEPALVFYDLNDRARPRMAPTLLMIEPLLGPDGRASLGRIHVNDDTTVTVSFEATMRGDPFAQQIVARKLRAEKNEALDGTFLGWNILGGTVTSDGVQSSECTSQSSKVSCSVTFRPDGALISVLHLFSRFGAPASFIWAYRGDTPEGVKPIRGTIDLPLSLLRQSDVAVRTAGNTLVNDSSTPVVVEYAAPATADGEFTPFNPALMLPPGKSVALTQPLAAGAQVPREAIYAVQDRDPLDMLRRFSPFENQPLLDWVRIANYLPADDAIFHDRLVGVDLVVGYGPPKVERRVKLTPSGARGSTIFLYFLRRAGANLQVTGTATYERRGSVPLTIDSRSFSVAVNADSLPK